jgi:signal transduction histidine kinase
MFRNLSLGTRLTVIVTVVVAFILIAITLIATRSSDNALRDQTVARFTNKTTSVTGLVNLELQRLQGTARELAITIGNMGNPNQSNELRQMIATFVRNDSDTLSTRFSVWRPDNRIGVFTMSNPLVPASYEWRVYSFASDLPQDPRFREPMQTGEVKWFLQEQAYADPERQPAITVVAPYRLSGRIAGVVWLDVPRAQFERTITQLLNDQGLLGDTDNGYAALLDDSGALVTLHNLSMRDGGIAADTQAQFRALPETPINQLTEQRDPLTGTQAFMSVRTFTVNNWRFITTLPVEEIPVLPSGVSEPVVIVSFIGLLVLVFAINGFTRTAVSEPLQRLGTAAQEIGAGDFRYFIAYRNNSDEIGRLAQALEDMRVSLEHSYDELSRWGRTLERRVVERTKELDIARQQAEASSLELRAIYNESLLVVNESQLKPILDALTARLPALLSATYAAVWLLNDDRDRIQLVASNTNINREGIALRVGQGVVGQAIAHAQPILVDDYSTYPHSVTMSPNYPASFERAIAVPLVYVGKPIGAMIVGRWKDAPPFTQDELRLLSLFANLVSPAVRNAQLFVRMTNAIDAAERANQVKTRFLASVTHELRTPLNLIINNVDFMRVGAFGEVNKEQRERLGQTVRSAEHLLYLINDLLDVSKIEAGEMQLFIQENDIATMLDDCIDNTVAFMDKIEGKSDAVEFVVDIDEDLPRIPMDVRRIRQVLTNLLTNAVKFTEKGTVSLVARRVEDGVRFEVSDTGMGIPPEEAEKLFQAFERTESAKQNMIEGTGLGLPISRYLVEQHGGELTFVSEVGQGTTFSFVLPLATPQPGVTDSQVIRRSDPSIAAILSSKTQI